MSSVDGESNVSGGSEQVSANTLSGHGPADPAAEGGAERPSSELRHIIEEEQKELGAKAAEDTNGTSFHGYRKVKEQEDAASEGSSTPLPRRGPLTGPMSPEGSISTPDDTPSIQVRPVLETSKDHAHHLRVPRYLPPVAVLHPPSLPFSELVLLRSSPLSGASPQELHRPQAWVRPEQTRRPFSMRILANPLYQVRFFKPRMNQKRRSRLGKSCGGPNCAKYQVRPFLS